MSDDIVYTLLIFVSWIAPIGLCVASFFWVFPKKGEHRPKKTIILRASLCISIAVLIAVLAHKFDRGVFIAILISYGLVSMGFLIGGAQMHMNKLSELFARYKGTLKSVLIVVAIIGVLNLLDCRYQNGYSAGEKAAREECESQLSCAKEEAYDDGYDDGYSEGYYSAESEIENSYDSGYERGYWEATDEHKDDWESGYEQGRSDGASFDYDTAWSDGYTHGYNYGLSQTSASATDVQPEPEKTAVYVDYIINTNTGKFHLSWCSAVRSMNESNKWNYTGTRDDVIDMGYVPCKRCYP